MLYEYNETKFFELLPKKKHELKYYLAGFSDAEGCFNVSIKKQDSAKFGWVLDPLFQVTQHKNSAFILEVLKRELNCGRVIEKPGQPELSLFLVDNRRQLAEKVIPFFGKYRPLTKWRDFLVFKEIVLKLEEKQHSDITSFKELLKKAFEMNQNGKQRRYTLEEILGSLKAK